jgi:CO dehydrogenase maturation factor
MQKIAICGKGGSGKSVITRLLAGGLVRRGLRVLLVDSDESNTGLHRMLGFDTPPRPLVDYLGGKQKVEKMIEERIRSGVPESMVCVMQRELSTDDLPPEFVLRRNGIELVMVGKILMALEGCACPMGIVSRSFLRDIILRPDQIALVDMEAGVEHFGRGVESSMDCVLVAVEPSFESLEIAGRIAELSRQIRIGDVWAVLNKVQSAAVAGEITSKLAEAGLSVIGTIPFSQDIFLSCLRGTPLASDILASEVDKILDFLFP